MRGRGRPTGGEALAAWLAKKARNASARFLALEEALLAGRFGRYASRRLAAFGLSRAAGTVVHLVELTWLFEIFSAQPFVASIALQNVTLVADAFFWGALEAFRRRARELGPTSEATALGARWLTIASWAGLAALAMPAVVVVLRPSASPILHAYAFVCALRLALDVVLRTLYSGVFAYRRVHRPMWSTLVGPLAIVTLTPALFPTLAGWSFVVALGVSVVASRALLLAFTLRAYRRFRLPRPRVRLLRADAIGVLGRDALLAGIANLSTRLGGVVLLAALVPSLALVVGPDDEPMLEPFAYALHLAAPFIAMASQWAFVFYHDWKRLEDDGAARLGELFERRLVVLAIVIGAACALAASSLVLLHVPWEQAWPTLAALFSATTGLSLWGSLQLRQFSRGEHFGQAASAVALVVVVVVALADDALGVLTFHAALAAGPWVAIAAHAVLRWRRGPPAGGEVASVPAFVDALARAGRDRHASPITLWDAIVDGRPAFVAARVVERLGARGALVRLGSRLVWFERGTSTRVAWLACAGGRIRSLARTELHGDAAALAPSGLLDPPAPGCDVAWLAAEHARLFPGGFVVRVGEPPPTAFLALAPHVRQAIWRDALRYHARARGRSGWFVTSAGRRGAPEAIFVAPRPHDPERAASFREALASADLRLARKSA